jgi:hypothetical protein
MTDRADAPTTRTRTSTSRRKVLWTIALVVLGFYVVVQLLLVWNIKDAHPPSWPIQVPANATMVNEPHTEYSNFRAVTYITLRPTDGRTADELIDSMGLSEQPTRIGPTPLDWRPLWVYSRSLQGNVEVRLVYVQDLGARVP